MTPGLSRREFVRHTTRLVAGIGATAVCGQAIPAAETSRIAVTCRDAMLPHVGQSDCWSALAAVGAEGVEAVITDALALPGLRHPDRKYTVATQAGLEQLQADMRAAGRQITAFCMFNRLDERPEIEIEWSAKVARAAQTLGIKAIRIDVVPHKLKPEQFLDFSVATLRKVMAATEGTGVAFGIENHGRVSNDPEFLQPLFERVGSPRLGLTLDVGNFYWFGHPLSKLYKIVEKFAPRVFHTHCKSIAFPAGQREQQRPVGWEFGRYTCPLYAGDIDYGRVVEILKKAGYANDLCVEDESLSHFPNAEHAGILQREIEYLKKLR